MHFVEVQGVESSFCSVGNCRITWPRPFIETVVLKIGKSTHSTEGSGPVDMDYLHQQGRQQSQDRCGQTRRFSESMQMEFKQL